MPCQTLDRLPPPKNARRTARARSMTTNVERSQCDAGEVGVQVSGNYAGISRLVFGDLENYGVPRLSDY